MDIQVDSLKKLLEMKINIVKPAVFNFYDNELKIDKIERQVNNIMYLRSGGSACYYQPELDNICECKDGDMLWLPYRSNYLRTNAHPLKSICFDFYMMDDEGNNIIMSPKIFRVASDTDSYYLNLYEFAIQKQMNTQSSFEFRALIYKLFSSLFSETERFSEDKQLSEIAPAIHSIERTPQSNISVAELAAQCGLSETSLRTKFRQYTGGMNPIDYRNSLRVSKAKELLSATNSSVEMIAETLGFYDSSYFIKVFRHFSGSTPNEYRISSLTNKGGQA